MRAIYVADTEGVVALAAATVAKSIFGVKGDAGHAIDLLGIGFSLDSVTAADKQILVELLACTFATQPPGTASTTCSVDSYAGPRVPETFSVAKSWTTEPTVVTPTFPLDYDPYKFTFATDVPLGEGPDFNVGEGFIVRMTVPTGGAPCNARVWAKWARV